MLNVGIAIKRGILKPSAGSRWGCRRKGSKGNQKVVAVKTEVKDNVEDTDTMWMVSVEENVKAWLAKLNEDEF